VCSIDVASVISLAPSSAIQQNIEQILEMQHPPVLNRGIFDVQNFGDELMNKSIPIPRYL
jgi:hypothetical protein